LRHARPPPDRRTPLRDDKKLDGAHPLPDEAARERENRNRPPRSGLQHEAGDADPRAGAADRRDPDLRIRRFSRPLPIGHRAATASFYTASVVTRRNNAVTRARTPPGASSGNCAAQRIPTPSNTTM